jgi:uncharacterized protein with beta-barrel porin domain
MWQHDFSATYVDTTAAFTAAPETPMVFAAARPGHDTAIGALGVLVDFGQRWSAFVNAGGHVSQNDSGYAVDVGVRVRW